MACGAAAGAHPAEGAEGGKSTRSPCQLVGKNSGAWAWCWPEQEVDPPAARASVPGWVMGAELAGRHTLILLEAMPQSHLPKCR